MHAVLSFVAGSGCPPRVTVAVVCATGMSMVPFSGVVAPHVVAVQAAVTVPAHAPAALQASLVVHGMPSLQVVPGDAAACAHPVAEAHESTVHGLPSSQLTAAAAGADARWCEICPVTH